MDGIKCSNKNVVYCKILSDKAKIGCPEILPKFPQYADTFINFIYRQITELKNK